MKQDAASDLLLELVLHFQTSFIQLFGELFVWKCTIREYCIVDAVTERVAGCYCLSWGGASVTEFTPLFCIKTRLQSLRLSSQPISGDTSVSAQTIPQVSDNLRRMGAVGGHVEQITLQNPVYKDIG